MVKIRSFLNFKNQRGIVFIYSVFFFIVALGFVALAADLGFAYVVSTELKSVADAAALTAAASFLTEMRQRAEADDDLTDAGVADAVKAATTTAANAIIQRSRMISQGAVTVNLKFGSYNTASNQTYNEQTGSLFTELSTANLSGISAFQVQVSRSGNGMTTFFARTFGVNFISMSRNSVSILAPRNFLMVIDTSGSMDDITYVRTTTVNPDKTVSPPATVWPPEESFISRPTVTANFPILFTPHAPATTDVFADLNMVEPEPLRVVLESSLEFLDGIADTSTLGDRAGVYYFARNTSAKINQANNSIIPITTQNITDVFAPLLTNRALYDGLRLFNKATALPNGSFLGANDFAYEYPTSGVGIFPYLPATEQFDGPIAIPQGNTNIGDAIKFALTDLSKSPSNTTQSITTMILFTDGMPDCAPVSPGGAVQCYGTGATADQLAAARNYVFQQAQIATDKNIRIYPITYGNFGYDGSDPDSDEAAEAAKATLLFDAIAQMSGLAEHFHIADTANPDEIDDELDDIFEQIKLLVPFSLVG